MVDLDAAGLPTGSYTAVLEVTSDDPVTPQVDVTVTLVVNDAPIVSFSPDSMSFTLDPSVQDSAEMWIFNTGAGPLEYTLEAVIGGSSLKPAHAKLPNGMVKEEMRADIKRHAANRGVANATEESRRNASSGIGVLLQLSVVKKYLVMLRVLSAAQTVTVVMFLALQQPQHCWNTNNT